LSCHALVPGHEEVLRNVVRVLEAEAAAVVVAVAPVEHAVVELATGQISVEAALVLGPADVFDDRCLTGLVPVGAVKVTVVVEAGDLCLELVLGLLAPRALAVLDAPVVPLIAGPDALVDLLAGVSERLLA